MENAAKYTSSGTPIEVTASKVDGDVIVEVSDRGPGVPEQEHERIFDKFQRGQERTKGGVGLGLTICRAIVTTHGGRIWVENREGAAPRSNSPFLQGEPPRPGSLPDLEQRGAVQASLQPVVLVIEDEPQMLRFLRASLGAHGYHLVEAITGAAGMTEAATRQPDVILLDLGLPDVDGLEVTRRLREWTRTPIIVLSARGRDEDKVEALDEARMTT